HSRGHENPTVSKQLFHDERAAAFHALGYARAGGKPAALICTSGTAAANYLPAVVEASMDMVPMLLLTADRPPELRDCGANQAIKQIGIFGDYTRWQFDMPCPDESIPPEFVLTTIDQAVHRATDSPCGPVHLNCMFREPFLPLESADESISDNSAITGWRAQQQPITRYEQRRSALSGDQAAEVSDIIKTAASGLLIAGRLNDRSERLAVAALAQKLGWPLLPDISSGLRLGADCETVIPYYDLLLQSTDLWKIARPSVVVHLGGRVVSKRLSAFLKEAQFDEFLHVADHPHRQDWQHQVTRRYQCTPDSFCEALTPLVTCSSESGFQKHLRSVSKRVGKLVERIIDEDDAPAEPGLARLISQHLPPNSGLFLANSLSIRLMDSFADFAQYSISDAPLPGCNRGASGIDGTIASATGYAAGLDRPATLLIGDLAFLHDLNSLAIVGKLKHPLTIVLINNDGGGIFSMLPIAHKREVFEPYFAAPHGLNFAASAEQFGLSYRAPAKSEEFVQCYRDAINSTPSTLIEVKTDRNKTRELYTRILEATGKTVAEL
ncbi:MAG: 2-succinyl-5-enolpyruvyl-6-hydroxy-3-cyclohexene-1-carboxylic-acid synthase, partial [candidate division Zixibacteria bacterium]|nr:2-succinyl-5-enolpyruvyl-6-hydroxy-3-cyclohexene-1-carboxylic-acid synthase [candidate division Zixibacteria bacterium]